MNVIDKGDRELSRKELQALKAKRALIVLRYRDRMRGQSLAKKAVIALQMRWEIWKLHLGGTTSFYLNCDPVF